MLPTAQPCTAPQLRVRSLCRIAFEDSNFLVVNKPFDLQVDGARPLTLEKMIREVRCETHHSQPPPPAGAAATSTLTDAYESHIAHQRAG